MTRIQLAAALVPPVTPGTIGRWERDGMPVAQRAPRGRATLFDQKAVEAWRDARNASLRAEGLSLEAERARLARAQAEGTELKNALRRGEVLELTEVQRTVGEMFGVVRARLLAIPSAVSEPCVAAAQSGGAPAVFKLLTEAVRDGLSELAKWRPNGQDRPSTDRAPAEVGASGERSPMP